MSTYGSYPQPKRVEILSSRSSYIKRGQFAYVLGWDKRGGFHMLDTGKASTRGQTAYLVSKTKEARGGALWFSGSGLRFTAAHR